MSNPSLLDSFSPQYRQFSMHIDELEIPATCRTYLPDNSHEGECRILIQPDPELGAPVWTDLNSKRALLAVYRDAGRKPAVINESFAMVWECIGQRLNIVSNGWIKHIRAGDIISLIGLIDSNEISIQNIIEVKVLTVGKNQDGYLAFQIANPSEAQPNIYNFRDGDIGSGSWRLLTPINFFEDYVVCRLLPSLKLIPISQVKALLNNWSPDTTLVLETLVNPTTGAKTIVESKPFYTTHSSNGIRTASIHRQQFNESNRPLRQNYDAKGAPIENKLRYTNTQSAITLLEPELVPFSVDKLLAFDYYGFLINDEHRLPYSSSQVIAYDSTQPNGLRRSGSESFSAIFSAQIFDQFGLPVIGAKDQNQLVLRDPIMPTRLDQFNIPYKLSTAPGFTKNIAIINSPSPIPVLPSMPVLLIHRTTK